MKIGDRIFVRGYIDEIRKDTVIVRNDGGYFGTVLSEVTGELPSAQPHWIPCGDRLPKKDGLYLCWYEYYHWSKEKILPEYGIGYYDVKLKFWGGEVAQGRNAKVLAWTPLPEPYKGERNEID